MFLWFSYLEETWRTWQLFATIARRRVTLRICSTTLGSFQFVYRINLSYFPSRARLNFRWILKEFDLKSNMKGFFENLLALSVKKLKKVLMIVLSISGRGRAYPAEFRCYMPFLLISNFYRRWTPKLENLTLADWGAWYEFKVDGLPWRKYIPRSQLISFSNGHKILLNQL